MPNDLVSRKAVLEGATSYGMDMDKEMWMRFLAEVRAEIERREGKKNES